MDWQGQRDLYSPDADESGLHDIAVVTKRIVSSPRLAGLRLLDGEVVTDQTGDPVLGRWEPIITPSEWEAVRRRCLPIVTWSLVIPAGQ